MSDAKRKGWLMGTLAALILLSGGGGLAWAFRDHVGLGGETPHHEDDDSDAPTTSPWARR